MRIIVVALMLMASAFCAPAQSLRCTQPNPPIVGCGWPKDTTDAQKRETGTALYMGSTALVVLSNVVWQWDQDHGGYPDKFYPEKALAHAGTAAALVQVGLALHVRPVTAIVWTNVVGLGFEVSQGHVNKHDLANNFIGSLVGFALSKLTNHISF